jgi:Pyruvate/2-oxoacid:ferredoxin oxidoreductase gamma subunit
VLPFGEETLLQVMKESLRPRYYELNLKAFQLGRRAFEAASDTTGTSD